MPCRDFHSYFLSDSYSQIYSSLQYILDKTPRHAKAEIDIRKQQRTKKQPPSKPLQKFVTKGPEQTYVLCWDTNSTIAKLSQGINMRGPISKEDPGELGLVTLDLKKKCMITMTSECTIEKQWGVELFHSLHMSPTGTGQRLI